MKFHAALLLASVCRPSLVQGNSRQNHETMWIGLSDTVGKFVFIFLTNRPSTDPTPTHWINTLTQLIPSIPLKLPSTTSSRVIQWQQLVLSLHETHGKGHLKWERIVTIYDSQIHLYLKNNHLLKREKLISQWPSTVLYIEFPRYGIRSLIGGIYVFFVAAKILVWCRNATSGNTAIRTKAMNLHNQNSNYCNYPNRQVWCLNCMVWNSQVIGCSN